MQQKYAKLSGDGNTIDSITFYPDRVLVDAVPAKVDEKGNIVEPAVEEHWGELLPGTIPVDDSVYAGFVKVGPNWVPPEAAPDPLPDSQQPYNVLIGQFLDEVARGRGYDNRVSLLSYKDSTVPGWAEEAATFATYRDQVFLKAFEILQDFQDGKIPQPTLQEFEEMLPEAPWTPAEN